MEDISKSFRGSLEARIAQASNPFILFTGDIESVFIVYLARKVLKRSIPLLFLDTGLHFAEVYAFVKKIVRLWSLNLIRAGFGITNPSDASRQNKIDCCQTHKACVIRESLENHRIDILVTGLSRQVLYTKWGLALGTLVEGCTVINPIEHVSREKIWNLVKELGLPYCTLYDAGYQDIDCAPCAIKLSNSAPSGLDAQVIALKLKQLGYF